MGGSRKIIENLKKIVIFEFLNENIAGIWHLIENLNSSKVFSKRQRSQYSLMVAKMGENFRLKWNDHHSIFFSTAEELCMEDHLTDITLSCGKQEFSAHKLVLSICSTYFKDLFAPRQNQKGNSKYHHRPASQAAIVYLKDVKPSHM